MFSYNVPVVLLGGGDCAHDVLLQLLRQSSPLIVADGGARHLEQTAIVPELIIGDLDSLTDQWHWESLTRVIELTEQDTTDFEKCLYSVDAPLYIALGFTGRRIDHTLASLHVVAKYSSHKQVILVGQDDIVLVCRGSQKFTLDNGMRFSIFPLEPINFLRSIGLLYPLDGLTLSPTTMVGTSNQVCDSHVTIDTEPGSDGSYTVIMPVAALASIVERIID